MNEKVDQKSETELAAEIVVAYLDKNSLDASQLPALVLAVRQALISNSSSLARATATSTPEGSRSFAPAPTRDVLRRVHSDHAFTSAVPNAEASAAETIGDDFVVCLEDGRRFRSLRRHLMAQHNLTPEAYRAKWNLPSDYPMVAPSVAEERSEIARRIKLGHSRRTRKPQP